jgi:hypothetical protein
MQIRRELLQGLPSAKGGIADVTEWFSPGVQRFSSHDGKNYTICRDSPVGCGGREWGACRQWPRRGSPTTYHTMAELRIGEAEEIDRRENIWREEAGSVGDPEGMRYAVQCSSDECLYAQHRSGCGVEHGKDARRRT